MEPITSKIPLMVIEGNHEIEPQGHGGEVTFASYLARFAVPFKESGSNTKFYYSFNAGGIHFIMLGAYVDYNHTGNNFFATTVSSLCSWANFAVRHFLRGICLCTYPTFKFAQGLFGYQSHLTFKQV